MISPASEAELAAAIRDARAPVRVRGGGTRDIGNPVAGEVLSTAGLSGIELYEPGALTLVVRSGTPVEEVEAVLAAEGQRLPFEPMDHRRLLGTEGTPTIGGVAAANVSGPRRVQVGACRDFMLGVRFVDGTGEVVKNGGRVMKNVTGYDLVKLMAGSWGTLGVLSEVSLKVLPAPAASGMLVLEGLDVPQAVAAMSVALGSPYEVTGAAHDGSRTYLRIEGFGDSVGYRLGELAALLERFGEVRPVGDGEAVVAQWRDLRDAAMFAGSDDDVWRIGVRPSDGPEVARRLEGARLLVDWGGGLVWAGVAAGTDVRAALEGLRGHATLVRADEETRRRLGAFHPEPAPVAALSRGLRQKFDPRGVLNAGLME